MKRKGKEKEGKEKKKEKKGKNPRPGSGLKKIPKKLNKKGEKSGCVSKYVFRGRGTTRSVVLIFPGSLVIVLFEIVWRVLPEWCMSHNSHLQVLPPNGKNPNYGVEHSRERNPCNEVWLEVTSERGISRPWCYVVEEL